MGEELVLNLGQETLKVAALLSAPLLLSALIVGVVVSVFQAITQINEATLTFIPKLVVMGIIFVIAGPWMLDVISKFTIELFENVTMYVRN
ncbi:MAG: flagellar biosynthesis protein FliQ [Bdellovibrionales bacterium]